MERYEAYKDSGVAWVGEIPEGWCVRRLKRISSIRRGSGIQRGEISAIGMPCVRYGELYTTYSNIISCAESHIPEELWDVSVKARPDDLVIALTGETREDIGLTAVNATGSLLAVGGDAAVIGHGDQSGVFLSFALNAEYFNQQKSIASSGEIIIHLGAEKIANAWVILPPPSEQQVITTFLVEKTAKIDSLVADCEREVELLQEYRKAVIWEAVTKGLNPNVPMKDSGVEWIGEIPEGWQCCRVKQVARISSGATPSRDNPRYWNGLIPWIKTGELCNDVITHSEETITEFALEETSVQLYPAGTILIAMYGQGKTRGMTGMLGLACATNQACAAMWVSSADDPRYVWKALIAGYDAIRDVALGSGQPNLNADLVANFSIPLPRDIDEQRSIVAYLDAKTAEIDSLISARQSMVEKLREYRRSLISEAVTGKFKVPGV